MTMITRFVDKGLSAYAKYFGNGINYTRKVAGVPVTTNIKTGTKVAKGAYGEGTKLIELGERNKLRQKTGLKSIIVDNTQPIDSRITLPGYKDVSFSPKEFAECVNSHGEKSWLGKIYNGLLDSYVGRNFYRQSRIYPHPLTGPDLVTREMCYEWGKPVRERAVHYYA